MGGWCRMEFPTQTLDPLVNPLKNHINHYV